MPRSTHKCLNIYYPSVIGLVSVYMYIRTYVVVIKKVVIERTRDLIYLKLVVTDFSPENN